METQKIPHPSEGARDTVIILNDDVSCETPIHKDSDFQQEKQYSFEEISSGLGADEVAKLQSYTPIFIDPNAGKPSLFICNSANETIRKAILQPMPKSLYNGLWYENEACCMFADTGSGKSILAVQIAHTLSAEQIVLYFDFELSDKQFQLRYTAKDCLTTHQFNDNLIRCVIDPLAISDTDFEGEVMRGIEEQIKVSDARIVIIDNISFLCLAAEKGDVAGVLMMKLMQLKRLYGLSILVLAHTPKRPLTNPITQNDLAGSKKLANFFDSIFAIGESCKDKQLRYIKQIKCRNGSFTLDAENVAVCALEKEDDCFLSFVTLEYANEKEHLKEVTKKESEELIAIVLEDIAKGKSYQRIAEEQRISKSKVQRIVKNNR